MVNFCLVATWNFIRNALYLEKSATVNTFPTAAAKESLPYSQSNYLTQSVFAITFRPFLSVVSNCDMNCMHAHIPSVSAINHLPKSPDGVLIRLCGAAAVGNVGVGPKPPLVLIGPPSVEESRVEQEVERGGHVDGEGRHHCWLCTSYRVTNQDLA